MSIRSYCPHCKQWVDLCQEVFGFKFDTEVFIPEEWVIVGSNPEGWIKVPLVPYTDWDDKTNFVALPDLEERFPDGVPNWEGFCYDTEDLEPVIEPYGKKEKPDVTGD